MNKYLIFALLVTGAVCTEIPQLWVDEAVGWFQSALRIDSTSLPIPGREGPFVAFIKGILDAEGIQNMVVPTPIPGTPFEESVLLAFLPGTNAEAGDLLLASHSDTVGVGSMPADVVFSGDIINGNIVGRGAADMKHKVIMDLAAMVWANRLGYQREKGLIYGVFPGEEIGLVGAAVTVFSPLAAYLANVRLVLDEGGGMTVDVLGKTYMPVAMGEKGGCPYHLNVQKTDGHATAYLPESESALLTMAKAMINIAETIPEPHYTDATILMLEEMKVANPQYAHIFAKLANPAKFAKTMKDIIEDDVQGAKFLLPQLVNLLSIVQYESFTWETITPGHAYAKVGSITIPGTIDNCNIVQAELTDAIDNPIIDVQLTQLTGMSPEQGMGFGMGTYVDPNSQYVSEMYNVINSVVTASMPDVTPTHALFQAISDCMVFTNYLGVPCLGFSPARMPEGVYFMDLFHSNYDYMPLASFTEGIQVYSKIVEQYTGL
jgi:acetylornithine deacetylase/succinyl-diaminopimelate desuccinylase-like protein